MELKDIYELWDRFEKSSTVKMELDFQGMHLKLSRELNMEAVSLNSFVTDSTYTSSNVMESDKKDPVKSDGTGNKEMKAPLVGIFYRAAAPGEKPFVESGAAFKKGDVVGIIEAMKVMNEIIATEDGIAENFLVKDAELVEYNQTLFTYRLAGEKYV